MLRNEYSAPEIRVPGVWREVWNECVEDSTKELVSRNEYSAPETRVSGVWKKCGR